MLPSISCPRAARNERGFDTRAAAALGPIVFRPELRDCGSQAFNSCSYRVAVVSAHARIDTMSRSHSSSTSWAAAVQSAARRDRLLALFRLSYALGLGAKGAQHARVRRLQLA